MHMPIGWSIAAKPRVRAPFCWYRRSCLPVDRFAMVGGWAARLPCRVLRWHECCLGEKRSVEHRVALRHESYGGNRTLVLHDGGRSSCGWSCRRPFQHECELRVRHSCIPQRSRVDCHCREGQCERVSSQNRFGAHQPGEPTSVKS